MFILGETNRIKHVKNYSDVNQLRASFLFIGKGKLHATQNKSALKDLKRATKLCYKKHKKR